MRDVRKTRRVPDAPCRRGRDQGQALLELVVSIPMLFLLSVIALNFGFLIYGWTAVEDATRAAADYAVLSGSSAGLPPTASSSSLQSIINAELTHLPGLSASNPKACVQTNSATLMEMPSGACASYAAPSGDTDVATGLSLTYKDVAVDISYAFTPLFPGSTVLGYALPGLPTTIHRRTVMRIL